MQNWPGAMFTLRETLIDFDPDSKSGPSVALRVDLSESENEMHQHRKGQLVLALRGGVTCRVPGALWLVPPHSGVWIPSGMPHSNRATANARICYLFVEPDAAALPDECCTLAVSSMLREMIERLADLPPVYPPGGPTDRFVRVLLDELVGMPVEHLSLPISEHPKLHLIANALAGNPGDRRSLTQWAAHVAMSERSLGRLVEKETALSFGRWRQQLRLIVALRRLSEGATVQQVSFELGYESTTAFITMFKKALGKTPGHYFSERMQRRGQ